MCVLAELIDPVGTDPARSAFSVGSTWPFADTECVGSPDFWIFEAPSPGPHAYPLRFSHGVAPIAARVGFPRGGLLLGLDLSFRPHFATHLLPDAGFDRRFPASFPLTSAATTPGATTATPTATEGHGVLGRFDRSF